MPESMRHEQPLTKPKCSRWRCHGTQTSNEYMPFHHSPWFKVRPFRNDKQRATTRRQRKPGRRRLRQHPWHKSMLQQSLWSQAKLWIRTNANQDMHPGVEEVVLQLKAILQVNFKYSTELNMRSEETTMSQQGSHRRGCETSQRSQIKWPWQGWSVRALSRTSWTAARLSPTAS